LSTRGAGTERCAHSGRRSRISRSAETVFEEAELAPGRQGGVACGSVPTRTAFMLPIL
jgi:hypothetical protein